MKTIYLLILWDKSLIYIKRVLGAYINKKDAEYFAEYLKLKYKNDYIAIKEVILYD